MDLVKGIKIENDFLGNPIGGLNAFTIQPWMQTKAFVCIDSIELLKEVVDEAIAAKYVVIDLESQGLDTRVYNGKVNHHIVGFALCYDGEAGFYAPVRHVSNETSISDPQNGNLPWDQAAEQIQRLLNECVCIYHNAPFDTELLWASGFKVNEAPDSLEDTQIMGWLVDSNRKRLSLKAQSSDILGWKMIEFKSLFPKGTKAKDFHFEDLHPEEAYVYASSDGICTWHLWNIYRKSPILQAQKVVYKIEKLLVPALRRMSRNKCHIDVAYLQKLDDEIAIQVHQIETEIKSLVGDVDLNIGSAKALGEALFDKLKLPNAGRTPAGKQWNTAASALEELDKKYKGKYPALSKVVKFRQLAKLRSTYLGNLINNLDDNDDGRFGIMACGAPTGRFAAPGGQASQGYTGVNPQAVPKVKKGKPNVRKGFIARDEFLIVAIDFAGVELRISGNLSGEPKWIDEFNHKACIRKYSEDFEVIGDSPLWHHCPYCHKKVGDIHSQTSEAVFGTAEEPYRSKSKGVNFGILYGAGGKTLAENIGVPTDEGYRIQKSFLNNLPGIQRWIRNQHKQAKQNQIVKTSFGRIRLIPEMLSEEKRMRSFGERTSVNTVVQGTSADITKIAMVACDRIIIQRGWEDDARILLTVHDEIVFEIRESMKDIIMPELGLVMCKCAPKNWPIPLTVDIEYGYNWGEVNNAWKPPAPVLKARHPDVKPFNIGDLFYDGSVYNGPNKPPTPSGEAPEPLEVEQVPEPTPTPKAPQEPVKASHLVQETLVQDTPEPKLSGAGKEFVYILRKPYTQSKVRKLEALLILASDGMVRLLLKSDTGDWLNRGREITVDPVYFQYKAEEWGL